MKIAIIGGGISGLVAAYRLHSAHDVTLFEANDYVGGHTNTVDVELAGRHYAIDTGFIVFNDRTYPNFCKLLDELNVQSRTTAMSFSVRCDRSGLEYSGAGLNGLFAQRSNLLSPKFYRLLKDWVRFNHIGLSAVDQLDERLTVGDFLIKHQFSSTFIGHYLLPMASAVWSCPGSTVREFPVRFLLTFFRNHGLLSLRNRPPWRVISGGSREYVAKIVSRLGDRVRTNTPVLSVTRDTAGITVRTPTASRRFDHVILACHSDDALRLLGNDATDLERELLSAFPYERNVAVLHTDTALLPRRRQAWASWNYHISDDAANSENDIEKATVTYNMNLLHGIDADTVFCVTPNSEEQIAPEKVIQRFNYSHPVFDIRKSAAQLRHREIINQNNTSFCGAYWGNGFHEDGVNSALAVCDALGEAEDKSQPSPDGQFELSDAGGLNRLAGKV